MNQPAPAPQRPEDRDKPLLDRRGVHLALAVSLSAALIGVVLSLKTSDDLSHLRAAMLSGSPQGHYHAVVEDLAKAADARGGALANLESAGSVQNLERLAAAAESCEVGFALAQEGVKPPPGSDLRLVARLPLAETVFFLAPEGDQVTSFAQLDRKRIGIGPLGSGTALVAEAILARLPGLRFAIVNASIDEQVQKLARREIDVGVFVMADGAAWIDRAVRESRLQIVGFHSAAALAARVPMLRAAVLPAGRFDPVGMLPPTDKPVLQVDTLVLANGCPHRSEVQGLLALLEQRFVDLVEHNRTSVNHSGLAYHDAARDYVEHGGPELLDRYAPWLADLVPLGNLVQVVMLVSILFNVMGAGHRFRLWRIDAGRVHLEQQLPGILGSGVVIQEVPSLSPAADHRTPEKRAQLAALIARLEELEARCRKQSLSMLVPMGQEMAYRYQETLITERIAILRQFSQRLG